MRRFRFSVLVAAALALAALASTPAALDAARTGPAMVVTPANVDISQRHLNESEEAIAVNPANPDNVVTVTNVGHAEAGLAAGLFGGSDFDGGDTGTSERGAPG